MENKDKEEAEEGEGQGQEQNNEVILPYLRTLSVVQPDDVDNNDDGTKIPRLLINGKEQYPCDITRATRSLVSLVRSRDYFSSDKISKVTDDMTRFDMALSVQMACKKYQLEADTKDHVTHLVTDIFPQVKDSILSTFKAQEPEQEQQPSLQTTTSEKKLYTNKQIARLEFEKEIMNVSNELLRNGVPCTRTPFYK